MVKPAKIKVKPNSAKRIDQKITFSFQYVTNNKKYNFEYFRRNSAGQRECCISLMDCLKRFSSLTWIEAKNLRNQTFESFEYSALNFSGDQVPDIPEKIFVIRFGSNKYRCIGFKKNNDPCFYILGYDFDYSAYDHGS